MPDGLLIQSLKVKDEREVAQEHGLRSQKVCLDSALLYLRIILRVAPSEPKNCSHSRDQDQARFT
jgi:hypothetical protein